MFDEVSLYHKPNLSFAEEDASFFYDLDVGHVYFKWLRARFDLYTFDIVFELIVKNDSAAIFLLNEHNCTYSIFLRLFGCPEEGVGLWFSLR